MNGLSFFHIEIILGVTTFLLTTYFGLLVFIRNPKSATHRLFFLLSLAIDTYIVFNFISLHPPGGPGESQFFWIRSVMVITSLLGPLLFLLTCAFPGEKLSLRPAYLVLVLLIGSASVYASTTPLIFTDLQYPNGQPLPTPGPGMPIFFLAFPGLFLLSFITLIRKYRRSTGKERRQLRYFLAGVISSFTFMVVSALFSVVIFKNSATVFLGPLTSVILMGFTAYAIFKHQLFDIKVLAAELLVGILVLILVAEGLFSASPGTIFYKVIFATIVAAIGAVLVRSVKKEVQQKEELAKLTESLQKANVDLREANVRLEELDRQKNEFLSIASHQLRTPLSIFNGYIELLEEGAYGTVQQQIKEALMNMDETNHRLVTLVDEFLDITRIEQGRTKFVFERADICALVTSVVLELSGKLRSKKLKIDWKKPAELIEAKVDQEKMRHIIFNFVDNAIKYSDQGVITVTVKKEDEGVAVRVVDQGVGFEENDRVNFFQKFYRGENVRGVNVTGTGLGLYVVGKFAEAHGGRVWAKSAGIGKGSEFGVWVPLDRPDDAPSPTAS